MRQGLWVAGWNDAGYMPEMEPTTFRTFEDAKRFIIGELVAEGDRQAEEARSDDEQVYTALQRDDMNALAEDLSAEAEALNLERRTGDALGSGLGNLSGDEYSEWSTSNGGVEYWIRFESLNVRHVSVFTSDDVDTLCVLWRGAQTFNVHTIDPYNAEGLDIGREVDVFTFEGADKPTAEEAEAAVEGWFANYIIER